MTLLENSFFRTLELQRFLYNGGKGGITSRLFHADGATRGKPWLPCSQSVLEVQTFSWFIEL